MTNQKEIWTPEQVEKYLQSLKAGSKRRLPDNVYVTEIFILSTDSDYLMNQCYKQVHFCQQVRHRQQVHGVTSAKC